MSRAWSGGDPPLNRCAVERGKQRLIAQQRVGFVRIGLRPQAAVLEQSDYPASYASRHPGHFSIVRRW